MAAKANQKEIECIIRVLEPERKANGTLAIHCRPVAAAMTGGQPESADAHAAFAQRKRRRRAAKKKRGYGKALMYRITPILELLFAILAASLSYLAIASAEFTRRGYFGVGGELIFSIGIGYLVYSLLGIKKSHRAQ